MKEWFKKNGMSVTAMIVSIIAVCIALPRHKGSSFDYLGLLVGILSILVTVLIGWQILNYLAFEKKIKEAIDERVEATQKKIERDYIQGWVSTNLLLIPQYIQVQNNDFVLLILTSIYTKLLKIEDYETADDVSMSVLGYFTFDIVKVDKNSIEKMIPILEKIGVHSNQTDILLRELKRKCNI